MTKPGPGSLVVVMYHYVRPRDPRRWGGIFPLEPAEFDAQLEALSALGDVVAASEIDAPPRSDRPRVLLTFDDGTLDQYEHAFPILARRKLPALVSVLSAPALERYVPTFHYVHVLVSVLGSERLWAALQTRFTPDQLGDPAVARRSYSREDSAARQYVKYALNFALAPAAARAFLHELFCEHVGPPEAFIPTWYLQERHIREMAAGGIEFCVHGHHHAPYQGSAAGFYAAELAPCERWLASVTGRRPEQYIAAFGGFNAAGATLRDCEGELRARGYRHVYLTEPGTNAAPGFFLRRLDCADLPPRKPFPWLAG